jgi:UDP-2,3-diacylglucosamine pyrophosphatase LpxH
MRHVVVLSDLHLWQATDHEELWMRYRHRRFIPDPQIAEMLSLLCAQIDDGELELCFNGDIFDFDVPPVEGGHTVAGSSPRRAAAAVACLTRILDDHELFLSALGRVLSHGHHIVFIAGNHDLQLVFKEVQELLLQRLFLACQREPSGPSKEQVEAQVTFQTFFHRTSSGIHVEHGNQYDPFCSVSDPLWPFRIDGTLQTNVGTLAIEHLSGKLGYFNPNVESSFLLTTREYFEHWVQYYLRTPRSLVGTWLLGSLRVVWHMFRDYGIYGPVQRAVELQSAQEAAHATLFALSDLRATMRLFGVDRALLLALLVLTGFLFALWAPLGVLGGLLALAVYRGLRSSAPADLGAVSEQVKRSARLIARIYGARAVIFGHTHEPAGRFESGVFYGNSGAWVPMYRDVACRIPVEESRPFIWLRDHAERLDGGLYRFHDGRLHLMTQREPEEGKPATSGAAARPKGAHARKARRRLNQVSDRFRDRV